MEPVGEITCFECKHQYQNEQEVITTWNKEIVDHVLDQWLRQGNKPNYAKTLDNVLFCPNCLHDW